MGDRGGERCLTKKTRSAVEKWWAAEFYTYVVKLTRAKVGDKQCHYVRLTLANQFQEVRTTLFQGLFVL